MQTSSPSVGTFELFSDGTACSDTRFDRSCVDPGSSFANFILKSLDDHGLAARQRDVEPPESEPLQLAPLTVPPFAAAWEGSALVQSDHNAILHWQELYDITAQWAPSASFSVLIACAVLAVAVLSVRNFE